MMTTDQAMTVARRLQDVLARYPIGDCDGVVFLEDESLVVVGRYGEKVLHLEEQYARTRFARRSVISPLRTASP